MKYWFIVWGYYENNTASNILGKAEFPILRVMNSIHAQPPESVGPRLWLLRTFRIKYPTATFISATEIDRTEFDSLRELVK